MSTEERRSSARIGIQTTGKGSITEGFWQKVQYDASSAVSIEKTANTPLVRDVTDSVRTWVLP